MKKSYLILSLLGLILASVACGGGNKAPKQLLEEASNALDSNLLELAVNLGDSLHKTYPKAIKERKEVEAIRKKAIEQICVRDIAYMDSVMTIYNHRKDSLLKADFVAERVKGYEEDGILRYKGYNPTSNPEAPYLDVYLKEQDKTLQIVSACAGGSYNHYALMLSDDKSGLEFKSDTIPYDGGLNYRYKAGGKQFERITYPEDDAMRMGEFCTTVMDAKLKVSLLRDGRAITFNLPQKGLEAILNCYAVRSYDKQLHDMQKHYDVLQKRLERVRASHIKE